jgi:hypothetical protein
MFRADTMRVNDAKKAAKLCTSGITQQSAEPEDAPTFRQSDVPVDVESARSAGLIPPVNSALVRAFANHQPLAQKETIAPEGGPSTLKVGPPTLVQASPTIDAVNREPPSLRAEAAGRLVISRPRLSTLGNEAQGPTEGARSHHRQHPC